MKKLNSKRFDVKSRKALQQHTNEDLERALYIELHVIVMHYPQEVRENALNKMLEIVREVEHDSNRKDKPVASGESR